ncbi:CDP-diacylglycerol--serine O-phosphatidyltransferase [Marinospirillum insulare]|uniref:CDP-diacylglycerol--serine O-phosphatidyltransferase n=1 Tax=Marinospirillum insulare TaxID=217169 RepID=A0ABQ5ZWX6_9GAMM|nr:CDP-diacylglycerol--serine O-phosphatidyltransferase [Marinospirillum insulare]GLR63971.1 phosphatidylserine synthase [Marinospirillum insulare]
MSLEKTEEEALALNESSEEVASEETPVNATEDQKIEDDFSRRAHRLVDEVIEEVVEEKEVNGKKEKHRGIYLLPNLFTTGALFSGFYAIVAGMNNDFSAAAIAIFIAMILDGLDGRVARMTGTESAFGAEYDSLADMVSFGVAPALVAFSWMLKDLGQTGWVVAFVFVAGAALRLARFNVHVGSADKNWFTGLPSPAAASVVAALVWVLHEISFDVFWPQVLVAFVIAAVGLLMVSNVRYYSFKGIDLKNRVPFVVLLAVVLLLAVVAIDPAVMLLILFVGYAASGPLYSVFGKQQKREETNKM